MSKINEEQAAHHALIAMYSEDMFDPSRTVLDPPLDARMSASWTLIGHLTAADALFGTQRHGLGQIVYYGFLARSNADANEYIAVVRGTGNAVEWIEDFGAVLVSGPPKGQVEGGFYPIYQSMRYVPVPAPAVAAAGQNAAAGIGAALPNGSTVTLIGHSLGSALATYLMADLARPAARGYVVKGSLFASPKPGDGNYAKDVDAVVGAANYKVFNYSRDIVPHMPLTIPLGFGFQALPQSEWITPANAQAKIRYEIHCNHHAYCYAAMLDFTSVQAIDPITRPCVLSKA